MKYLLLPSLCAASSLALADNLNYLPTSPPVIYDTGIQVQVGSGATLGPQGSTGTYGQSIDGSYALARAAASQAGSFTGSGSFSVKATLTGDGITGSGLLKSGATLGSGGSVMTNGLVDLNVYFTLTSLTQVTVDLTTISMDTLANAQNIAGAVLEGPDSSAILEAITLGDGRQSTSWSGLLGPGQYLLAGVLAVQDSAGGDEPGAANYASRDSFSFDLTASSVPEPGVPSLLTLGFLFVLAARALTARPQPRRAERAVRR